MVQEKKGDSAWKAFVYIVLHCGPLLDRKKKKKGKGRREARCFGEASLSGTHIHTHTHVFFCPVGSSFARLALLFLFLLVFEALLTFCVTTYTLKRVAQAGGVGREVAFSEVWAEERETKKKNPRKRRRFYTDLFFWRNSKRWTCADDCELLHRFNNYCTFFFQLC